MEPAVVVLSIFALGFSLASLFNQDRTVIRLLGEKRDVQERLDDLVQKTECYLVECLHNDELESAHHSAHRDAALAELIAAYKKAKLPASVTIPEKVGP